MRGIRAFNSNSHILRSAALNWSSRFEALCFPTRQFIFNFSFSFPSEDSVARFPAA